MSRQLRGLFCLPGEAQGDEVWSRDVCSRSFQRGGYDLTGGSFYSDLDFAGAYRGLHGEAFLTA